MSRSLFAITASVILLAGSAVIGQEADQEADWEIDPAPSGIEMQEVYVFNNGIVLGLPGADSGIVYDGGEGVTVFDFTDGVDMLGGVGGPGGFSHGSYTTIPYEHPK